MKSILREAAREESGYELKKSKEQSSLTRVFATSYLIFILLGNISLMSLYKIKMTKSLINIYYFNF